MLVNLLLGLPTMMVCLLLQSTLLALVFRYYLSKQHLLNSPAIGSSLRVLNGVMILLVIGNLLQVVIWAGLFLWLGEFRSFDEAVYHSAVNFATLGYGDIVMSSKHRLLGAIEAINGVLMVGLSTAALMSALQDSMRKTMQARRSRKTG